MPAANSPWGDDLVAAVRSGQVSEADVDAKVGRLLLLAARVGALDGIGPAAPAPPPVAGPVAAGLLREAAAEGMVLLANPAGLLPLAPAGLGRVAMLGANATEARSQGGGSASVHPPYTVSPLAGLRTALAGRAEVVHVAGTRTVTGLVPVGADLATDPVTGSPGVLHEALDADGRIVQTDHRLSGRLSFFPADASTAVTLRVTCRLRADQAGEWSFGFAGLGVYRLAIDGGTVLDETLFPQDVDYTAVFADPPQQKVTRTLAEGQLVDLALSYDILPGAPMTLATLGCERPVPDAERELANAVEAARQADVAVVVVGTTSKVESEGFDRADLTLPGNQDDLVRAVAAANPRTVVVVNSGAPVLMPWRDRVGAVLLSWFGGQEMGNALADVLLGRVEPGGRLPSTWPAREQDVPVLSTRPAGGVLDYAEGIHVGYRGWLRAGTEPAYPFGHGLGYTSWDYRSLAVDPEDPSTVRVTVRNTGDRPGKEVIQAYLSRPASAIDRPVRWLAGFTVVRAEPGETVSVPLPLDSRSFEHWSIEEHRWLVEPGTFHLAVGRSVADTPLTATLNR
jgi:beta-glucosidase